VTNTTSFVDALEHELRAASRRRVRLALARVPRVPAGAAAVVVALAVCAAVAVPLLQTHSGSSPEHPAADGASRPAQTPTVANSGHSSTGPVRKVLAADRIGRAAFGERPAVIARRLGVLLARPPSKPYHADPAGGGVDHVIQWPGLDVFFGRGRFVGYSYGQSKHAGGEPALATSKGLRVGDTVATGKRLYGPAFEITAQQGGAWFATTPQGRLMGYTSEVTNANGKILTIQAGHVGGPALTP
jgi:hypothetical protein